MATVITGVIGQDPHGLGSRILSRALRENRFNVVALGIFSTQEDFIKAAQETNADAILISSHNGMAAMDCRGFKEKCVEAGLGDVLLYIGGHLKVGRYDLAEAEKEFKAMGFDRVYPPQIEDLAPVFQELREDLKKKGKG